MGGATRGFYVDVLREALGVLEATGADNLVIGGVATRSLLGMPLSVSEDLDVLIRPDDAARLLAAFADRRYATHRRDDAWIYKAARPDVTVDLIFRAGETIELDEEHLARSRDTDLDGIRFRVPSPEDLAVMKAIFDGDDRQGRWYGALALLRRFDVDWDYLVDRGAVHAPRRVLSLLLYAEDAGIAVPAAAVDRLASATLPSRI